MYFSCTEQPCSPYGSELQHQGKRDLIPSPCHFPDCQLPPPLHYLSSIKEIRQAQYRYLSSSSPGALCTTNTGAFWFDFIFLLLMHRDVRELSSHLQSKISDTAEVPSSQEAQVSRAQEGVIWGDFATAESKQLLKCSRGGFCSPAILGTSVQPILFL